MRPPNVLLLYTDQQRWDTIGAAGCEYMHTPNLDRIARDGVLFENAFANNPVCMPSRQSMLSGQYPSVVGCCTNGVEYPRDAPHLATILKPHGYHTANIGKLHFLNHSERDHTIPHPSYGFDTMINSDEPGCYDDEYIAWVREQDPDQVENCRCDTPPAWTGEPRHKQPRGTQTPYVFAGPEHLTHTAFVATKTIETIEKHKHDPFFCIAGFYAPHAPVNPPQRFVDMYDVAAMPPPAMSEGDNHLGLSEDEWKKVRAHYFALVSHIDDQVGRILKALEDNGLLENTLILFTSDHGDHLGDHGIVAKGPPGLDSCAHVPLLVSWPGRITGGQRKRELIELVDIAPTLLDCCGVESPKTFQGRSFRPLMEGKEYEPRNSVFIEFRNPFKQSWKTVRTHGCKYCASNFGEELLFDLSQDPHELTNVIEDPEYRDILHAMRDELLRRWFDVEKQIPERTAQY
jgi:arylsulfatase A-like enzyme